MADKPRISPFGSFYNSQVNGAGTRICPSLVWEEHLSVPPFSLLRHFHLLLAQFLLVANLAEAVSRTSPCPRPSASGAIVQDGKPM